MAERWQQALQRHTNDPFAHPRAQARTQEALEQIVNTWQARFLEVEVRLTRLERWRERSVGAAGVLTLLAMAGGLTVVFHLLRLI